MSKEQEVKHTELPWIISTDGNHIAHRDKTGVAIFINPEDGRFAVFACNSHYALKKEVEELRAYANSVERLLKAEIEHLKAQEPFIKHILKQLENLKP